MYRTPHQFLNYGVHNRVIQHTLYIVLMILFKEDSLSVQGATIARDPEERKGSCHKVLIRDESAWTRLGYYVES